MNQYIDTINIFFNITFIYNGVYDIICCISILYFPNNKISHIHSNVFCNAEINCFTKRILSYWMLTYSIPRIIAGFCSTPLIKLSCAITYLIEGAIYHIEYKYYNSTNTNALFVIGVSYIFCIISCLQAWNNSELLEFYYLLNKITYSHQNISLFIINSILWYFGTYLTIKYNQ